MDAQAVPKCVHAELEARELPEHKAQVHGLPVHARAAPRPLARAGRPPLFAAVRANVHVPRRSVINVGRTQHLSAILKFFRPPLPRPGGANFKGGRRGGEPGAQK